MITHDVTVLDPVKVFGEGGELSGDGEMRLPHFFAKQGSLPGADKLAAAIKVRSAVLAAVLRHHTRLVARKRTLSL